MILGDIIAQFRDESGDSVAPYLWSDPFIISAANEAVTEAAIRSDLIFDSTTAAVCEIALSSAAKTYALHAAITRVDKAYLIVDSVEYGLQNISRDELGRLYPQWRVAESAQPTHIIVDDTTAQVWPTPDGDYTLYLEVYRVPLTTEAMSIDGHSPVISEMHHNKLFHWALHRAYGRRDVGQFDPDRSRMHLAYFTQYFGERPDANLKRKGKTDQPHTNKVWL